MVMNFRELGLSEQTVQAIDEYGITEPTTVQADVIPAILAGRDIFTIAPARCGKTMSYVLPLLDIINAIFNKYHEINGTAIKEGEDMAADEANVIIGAPDLLLEVADGTKVDLSQIDILVVDDINLIKKNKQLGNLEKVLAMLPANKQNVIYTNRRSKETQDILDKIMQTPAEIKIDKNKEQEAETSKKAAMDKKNTTVFVEKIDNEAVSLAKKLNSFNGKTPKLLLIKGIIAEGEEK